MRQLIALFLLAATAAAQSASTFDQGLQAAQRQDFSSAKRLFMQAYFDAPSDARPLFNLGVTHAKLGNDTAAIAWFEAYLAAAPNAENASQVRTQISQLRRSATGKLETLFASAEAGAAQLGPDPQKSKLDSIRFLKKGSLDVLQDKIEDDSRTNYARKLVELGDAEAALKALARTQDPEKRDIALLQNSLTLARAGNDSDARQFVAAIVSPSTKANAQREVDQILTTKNLERQAEEAIRQRDAQKAMAMLARLLPETINSTEAANWVRLFARERMFAQAEGLISRVKRPYWHSDALGDVMAWQVRYGDMNAARDTARRLLQRYPVPREDWLNLEDALLKAEHGDVDGGLRVIANRINSPAVKIHAVKSMEELLGRLKNDAAKLRAQRMRESFASLDAWEHPAAHSLLLATALTGDWRTAFAIARGPFESMGIYGFMYLDEGWVADGLNTYIVPGAPYAALALIATLERKNSELKRVQEELGFHRPQDRIVPAQNVAWAHTIAGRLDDALKALPQIPGNDQHGALARAQVVSAIAFRYAASGRTAEARRVVERMPAAKEAAGSWPVIVLLQTQALVAIAKAAPKGSEVAEEAYQAAASLLKRVRSDSELQQLLQGSWTNEKIKAAEAMLRQEDPNAAQKLGTPALPAVPLWVELASEISAEPPEEKLKQVSQRQDLKSDMPFWLAMTASKIFDQLMKIDFTAKRAAALR